MITGKAQEAFDAYLAIDGRAFYTYERINEWLDSVNIHLDTYAHYHKYEFKHFAFTINGLDRTGEFKTRKEAFEAGVEMAVEIFNNR